MRHIRSVVLAMLLVLLPALALGADASTKGLVLIDLGGKKVPLDTLLAKGPVVLNFWATWCGPCRLEMPQLQKIYQELAPKGVQFCAVSLDRGMSKTALEQFLQRGSVTIPVYRDETGTLAKAFKVTAIPATMVFAKGGSIYYQTKGFRPGDEVLLKKKIEGLLPAASKVEGAN
jgi:thiol-disulfide isomerase/thioredoxin